MAESSGVKSSVERGGEGIGESYPLLLPRGRRGYVLVVRNGAETVAPAPREHFRRFRRVVFGGGGGGGGVV